MLNSTHPVRRLLPTFGLLAVAMLLGRPVSAQTLTFDGLGCNLIPVAAPYIEAGFSISAGPTAAVGEELFQNCSGVNNPGIGVNFFADIGTLTRVGGGAFSISSIDLFNAFGETANVMFTGILNGGGSVMTTAGVTASLTTFLFGAGWDNLVSLQWDQNENASVVDNIHLSTSSQETVPEPATMTLLASGLMGIAATRRRKKRAA